MLALAVAFVLLATTGWTAALRPHAAKDAMAAALAAWARGSVGDRRLPDPGAAPATVTRFFAALTAPQRLGLVRRYPLVVGNLDGVDPALRYRANRFALTRQRTSDLARERSDQLTAAGHADATDLADLDTSLLSGDRQILAYDPTGDGRVAEVLGDLRTATRIAVVVPGVGTDLSSFERDDAKAYSVTDGMARALYGAELAARPGARTAVIAWADYDTPHGLGLEASTGTLAARGALRLESLLASLPRRRDVALFCHSYGSVLCGLAAPHLPPGRVRDIAVMGSPGMRADDVADLRTTAHVWAARDAGDWIADVPHVEFAGLGHGPDPISGGFGARVVSAAGADGHAGYFVPGTTSLANFADIALGDYSAVICPTGHTCTSGLV
ncbi:alpha/beta hydrolase [Actinacidiphila yanglinensis]|uniref:alpha/beta hydrolase n=1 Tax=Actinacidiphila yanglinensis TaxID=310779 RepID=UPI001F2130DD|nr:alpha/beta hydrolase [Actinacidiphila yanglinensis]